MAAIEDGCYRGWLRMAADGCYGGWLLIDDGYGGWLLQRMAARLDGC